MSDNFRGWRFVEIGGMIELPPGSLPNGDVAEAFIEWVEPHGWYSGGGLHEVNEDGKPIKEI